MMPIRHITRAIQIVDVAGDPRDANCWNNRIGGRPGRGIEGSKSKKAKPPLLRVIGGRVGPKTNIQVAKL